MKRHAFLEIICYPISSFLMILPWCSPSISCGFIFWTFLLFHICSMLFFNPSAEIFLNFIFIIVSYFLDTTSSLIPLRIPFFFSSLIFFSSLSVTTFLFKVFLLSVFFTTADLWLSFHILNVYYWNASWKLCLQGREHVDWHISLKDSQEKSWPFYRAPQIGEKWSS